MAVEFRIESDYPLESDWMPKEAFTCIYTDLSAAMVTAMEGVEDPGTEEVRVVDASTGAVVWRSTEEQYE